MKIAASLAALYVSIATAWFAMLMQGIPLDYPTLPGFIGLVILPEAIAVTIGAVVLSAAVGWLVRLVFKRQNYALITAIDLAAVFLIVLCLGSRGRVSELAHYARLAIEITAFALVPVVICNFLLMRNVDAARAGLR